MPKDAEFGTAGEQIDERSESALRELIDRADALRDEEA